jgi:copper chaperone CopZ
MAKKVKFNVEDMHCQSCVKKITDSLNELDQKFELSIDVPSRSVNIEFDPSASSAMVFKKKIEQSGFKVDKMESSEA